MRLKSSDQPSALEVPNAMKASCMWRSLAATLASKFLRVNCVRITLRQ